MHLRLPLMLGGVPACCVALEAFVGPASKRACGTVLLVNGVCRCPEAVAEEQPT